MSETTETSTKKPALPRYRGHSRLLKSGGSGNLSVPSEMMTVLAEGLLFKPELTKDGILFRLIDEDKMVADDKTLPAWVTKVKKPTATATTDGNADPTTDDAIVDDEEVDPTEPPDEAF